MLHAEELMKAKDLISFIEQQQSFNFLAFSWGQDLNNHLNRSILRQANFDGIIYDRINERNYRIEIKIEINDAEFAEYNIDPLNDSVFITGSNGALGNWNINKAIKLTKSSKSDVDGNNEWTTSIDLQDKKFEYKFFIAKQCSLPNDLLLKSLQLHKQSFEVNSLVCNNNWDSSVKPTVKGWLLKNQFEIHFNFYDCPLKLTSDANLKLDSIKIIPLNARSDGKSETIEDYIFNFNVSSN